MNKLILDGHKLNWHKERLEAWLNGERIAPITMDISLSTRCPYRCIYCYGLLQTPRFTTLPRDVIMRLLDDAAEIGVKGLVFQSDGESTCSPDFYEAIARGKANGLDLGLATNAYLLKEERLEEILPALEYVRFNISAAEPHKFAEIMGCPEKCYSKVIHTISECVRIKRKRNLKVTLGTSMVLMPHYADQILPLVQLSKDLGVDYFIIKHCSDDEEQALRRKYNFQYSDYRNLYPLLEEAEACSTEDFQVAVKWNKILSEGRRSYSECYGPLFFLQASGNGLLAPCGKLFPERFKEFHIGYLQEKGLKELWQSDRYWQIMGKLSDGRFNPRKQCGVMCAQDDLNKFLWNLKAGRVGIGELSGEPPMHVNFI